MAEATSSMSRDHVDWSSTMPHDVLTLLAASPHPPQNAHTLLLRQLPSLDAQSIASHMKAFLEVATTHGTDFRRLGDYFHSVFAASLSSHPAFQSAVTFEQLAYSTIARRPPRARFTDILYVASTLGGAIGQGWIPFWDRTSSRPYYHHAISGTTTWTLPSTTKPAEPLSTTPAEPLFTKPAEPFSTKPAEPLTTTPAEPPFTNPAEPCSTKPVEPLPTTSAEPLTTTLLTKPGEYLFTKQAEPLSTKPEEPFSTHTKQTQSKPSTSTLQTKRTQTSTPSKPHTRGLAAAYFTNFLWSTFSAGGQNWPHRPPWFLSCHFKEPPPPLPTHFISFKPYLARFQRVL